MDNLLKYLYVNYVETFAFVKLSYTLWSTLSLFLTYLTMTSACSNTNLTNITIDADTATTLNRLNPYKNDGQGYIGFVVDRYITIDSVKCKASGGTIQQLFKGKTNFSIEACVLSANSTTSTSSMGLGIILSIVAGVIAIGIAIVALIYIRRKKSRELTLVSDPFPKKLPDYAYPKIDKENTESCDGPNKSRPPSNKDFVIDVTRIRNHRLEACSDLVTPSEDQGLLLWLESPFVVKFIGASWIRPIEMQCYTYIQSIIGGLLYLHTYNPSIIHRDLKSPNVLMDSEEGTKLVDFGLSRVIEDITTLTAGIGLIDGWHLKSLQIQNIQRLQTFIHLESFCQNFAHIYRTSRQGNWTITDRQTLILQLKPSFDGKDVPPWVKEMALECLQFKEKARPTAVQLVGKLRQATKSTFITKKTSTEVILQRLNALHSFLKVVDIEACAI
ncbi:hypothetical protein THRCLA_06820, partial [Thraustotheca clavata]